MGVMHDAAATNNLEVLEQCITTGLLVNETDPVHGRTPLHFAAENGHAEAARMLLNFGANPRAIDAYGLTPLEVATENGHVDVAGVLQERIAIASHTTVAPRWQQPTQAPSGQGPDENTPILFVCPHCGKTLRVPAKFIGDHGTCKQCGGRIVITPGGAAPEREGAYFEERFVKTYQEALEVFLKEALPATSCESEAAIRDNHARIALAWKSRELVECSENAMKGIVEKNLKVLGWRTDFEEFQILVDLEGASAAQIVAICGNTVGLHAIRVWRSPTKYFICGGSDFVPHA